MKETYGNMEIVLQKIKYSEHNQHICWNLKVVAVLSGLQLGFTKHSCFLREWDSRARNTDYARRTNSAKDPECKKIIKELQIAYKALGCNISLKMVNQCANMCKVCFRPFQGHGTWNLFFTPKGQERHDLKNDEKHVFWDFCRRFSRKLEPIPYLRLWIRILRE